MLTVRRRQGLRAAVEQRALVSALPVAECVTRLAAVTLAETGETTALEWPPPAGKRVYGWVADDGFMISPLRQHERLSLNLAWGGWVEQEGHVYAAVDLLSLKSSRPLLLLLPVVGCICFLGFSLLAGQLLLSGWQMLAVSAIVVALLLVIVRADERRSIDDHRLLFTLLLETLEAAEVPRHSLVPDELVLPPAPERPAPPAPVPWRR
ncbi:MAG: hypothetical protein DCC58_02695 [Chloroflexi bacterium]|nr:MAG: hypothetical protein DCC58_02695 [Chloroflexota bacterium]